ncbi:FkbM family methyltransferase [Methylobacterium marchantiae]|uniref:FkbM family methyltransferase n=1 Tax=Methylobacterium marchantiae TaxID=600331 RepID=A0ABW3X0T6_9HYPH
MSRKLTGRQKSTLRHFAHRIGKYKPREIERMIDSIIVNDGAKTFLQIGANDGYYSDPLNLAIFSHRIEGTFVEPQTNYHRALRNTYAGFGGMTFLRCAIARQAGTMTMYTLDCSSGRLPGWACGVGTLSREQILKSGDQIPNIDAYIRSDEVNCITVDELLARSTTDDPDIIAVDAEGFDYDILSQFDFAKLSAKLVVYESDSMKPSDAASLGRVLTDAGFALIETGQDTIALRRDTHTFRASNAGKVAIAA